MFRAIRDVSRETQSGILKEQLQAGLITEYGAKDLETAYRLYREAVEFDV